MAGSQVHPLDATVVDFLPCVADSISHAISLSVEPVFSTQVHGSPPSRRPCLPQWVYLGTWGGQALRGPRRRTAMLCPRVTQCTLLVGALCVPVCYFPLEINCVGNTGLGNLYHAEFWSEFFKNKSALIASGEIFETKIQRAREIYCWHWRYPNCYVC